MHHFPDAALSLLIKLKIQILENSLFWIWKMLPTVNLTPLPYGEGVLTHKESGLWIRTKKKKNPWVYDKSVTCERAKTTEITEVSWSLYLEKTILTLLFQVPSPFMHSAGGEKAPGYRCTFWTKKEMPWCLCCHLKKLMLQMPFMQRSLTPDHSNLLKIQPCQPKEENPHMNCVWLQTGWYH